MTPDDLTAHLGHVQLFPPLARTTPLVALERTVMNLASSALDDSKRADLANLLARAAGTDKKEHHEEP